MHLCDAAFDMFWTYEGDHFQVTALRGVPVEFAESVREPQRVFHAGTGLGRLLHGEDLTIHLDMAKEEAYRAGDPLRWAIVDNGGARSAVTVALRKDEILLGAFTVYRQEVRPFSGQHVALLQNFAAQAVIAMENARLLTETQEALEQQTATAEVLQVINSSPGDLAPVFDAILEKATSYPNPRSASSLPMMAGASDTRRFALCRQLMPNSSGRSHGSTRQDRGLHASLRESGLSTSLI
jgi:hypothetical protein